MQRRMATVLGTGSRPAAVAFAVTAGGIKTEAPKNHMSLARGSKTLQFCRASKSDHASL